MFPGVWVMGRIFDGYFDKIDLPSPTEGGFDNLIAFNFKLCTVSLSEMQNVKTRRDMRAESFVLLWCSRCTYVCHLHQSSKITLYSFFIFFPGLLRVPERRRGGKSKGGRDHFFPLWQHHQQQQQSQQQQQQQQQKDAQQQQQHQRREEQDEEQWQLWRAGKERGEVRMSEQSKLHLESRSRRWFEVYFIFLIVKPFLSLSRILSNITKNIIRRISDDNYFSLFPTTIFGFWFVTNHNECHNQTRFICITHKFCSITFPFYPPWPFVCKHPSQHHNLPVILKIISRNFPKIANFSKNFHNYQKL